MNSEQIKDMHLLYNAVYDEELREKFEEYNNAIHDEDIVEVATEYFYSYGLNEDGIDILIEELGVGEFVEFVYDIAEDYYLTEARAGGAKIEPKLASGKEIKGKPKAASLKRLRAQKAARQEAENKASESKPSGMTAALRSQATKAAAKKQPEKESTPTKTKQGIGSKIGSALKRAGEDIAITYKVAREVGKRAEKSAPVRKFWGFKDKEEVKEWVNQLVEEGYDLSEYTWDDMFEIYLDEKTAMTKRGLDEPAIRNQIAANTKGGESADRAKSLSNKSTYGSDANKKTTQRDNYSRSQMKDFRRTNSSSPGLRGYGYQSNDPAVKELQSARGTQRGTVTLTPNERAISNRSSERTPSKPARNPAKLPIPKGLPKGGGNSAQDVTDDPNSKPIAARYRDYKVGGSQGYGISGIKLADSFDLYDVILSHLIEEGYAESVEQAEVIMVNMSEDWRNSICESAVPGKPAQRLGAITSIPEDEREAARQRTLAKAKEKREKMGKGKDRG